MSWPGQWHSKGERASDKGTSLTNDNGIFCLVGETGEEYLFMERKPPEMELRR